MVNSTTLKFNGYSDEIKKALEITQNAISALKLCNENTNLREDIGIYAREMPNFHLLSSREITNCIRRVCTGEIEPKDAIKILSGIESHLTILSRRFNN